jgi:transmembrane sensor
MDANERRRQAAAEAAQWWVRLEGDASRAVREEFTEWLRESALHVSEMLRTVRVDEALRDFDDWRHVDTDLVERDPVVVPLRDARKSRGRKVRLPRKVLSVAAAAAVLALGVFLALQREPGQTIETRRGERREVALADGSVVQADSLTTLSVRFDDRSREVTLQSGRAVFRVAKAAERPFSVRAGETIVRALGTTFGVERRGTADVVVTVMEGKVAISRASDPGAMEVRGAESRTLALDANEQAVFSASTGFEPVRQVDGREALAWAQGRLTFENETVAEVVARFNRHNQLQVRIADPALAQRRVSGVFEISDPESFVSFIQSFNPVRVVRGDDDVITLAAEP